MPKAFLITPMSPQSAGGEDPQVYQRVQQAIRNATAQAQMELMHPSDMQAAGAIMEQVRRGIAEADVILAVLTGKNSNVYLELGYSRREAILIASSTVDITFDVRAERCWTYGGPGELDTLELRLVEAIRQTLATAPRPPLRMLTPAISLPDYFVSRPEIQSRVKQRLLAAGEPQKLLLQGLAGSGKSVLAANLTFDAEVLARFRDGVLWVTLGQTPDPLAGLNLWIAQLGGPGAATKDAATQSLSALLKNSSALLIIDDAWKSADVRPFLAGGPDCRIMITSRDREIARDLKMSDSAIEEMPMMTQNEALALMARRLDPPEIPASDQDDALQIASAIGYLPLAIDLAAGQIADGVPWSEMLAEMHAETARLERLQTADPDSEDEGNRKNVSLLVSFSMSIRRLPDQERTRFVWMGIIAEDAVLSARAAAVFWNTDVISARDSLIKLRSRAILQRPYWRSAKSSKGSLHFKCTTLCAPLPAA
jgi:NB-ARC domain